MDSIKILPSKEIDKAKWDACVQRSENGLIYARSSYLDIMADNWDGLVMNDYEAVMPLTWRRKFGIKYFSKPRFIQQLGVIGNYKASKYFMDILAKQYQYGEVPFNYKNVDITNEQFLPKTNYVLDLNRDYQSIYIEYKKSLLKKLKKISELQYMEADFNEVVDAYWNYVKQKHKELYENFERMKAIFRTDFGKKYFHSYQIIDESRQPLLFGIYAKDERRIYNLMTVHVNNGKEKYAMIFSIDFLIRKYANQPLLFDFIGSELPGVKTFLQNFSPINQPYFVYHFNHLPRLVKLFKK